MAKRHTRHKRQRRNRHRTMKGGTFTEQELQQLQSYEFSPNQISSLQQLGVTYNEIIQKIYTIQHSSSSSDIPEQVMIELLNEHIFENPNTQQSDAIPDAPDDPHNLDESFQSQGTMNLDELNLSQGTMDLDELNSSRMSGYTTSESDDEFGGRRRRRTTKKQRGKKGRKTRRHKQRGGMCFGNGVGANSNDPNYSIYNTNMLKLFPYKP